MGLYRRTVRKIHPLNRFGLSACTLAAQPRGGLGLSLYLWDVCAFLTSPISHIIPPSKEILFFFFYSTLLYFICPCGAPQDTRPVAEVSINLRIPSLTLVCFGVRPSPSIDLLNPPRVLFKCNCMSLTSSEMITGCKPSFASVPLSGWTAVSLDNPTAKWEFEPQSMNLCSMVLALMPMAILVAHCSTGKES